MFLTLFRYKIIMSKVKRLKKTRVRTVPLKPIKIQLVTVSKTKGPSRMKERLSFSPKEIASGIPPTPDRDLIYHGGRTIAHLFFTNLFVGGTSSWLKSDINSIDQAISGAMADKNLNNVIAQYFPGKKVTSIFNGSKTVEGPWPEFFTTKDVEVMLKSLYLQKKLAISNLKNTVFNLILPRKTILEPPGSGGASESSKSAKTSRQSPKEVGPELEEDDSLNGLGGYHGSVHFKQGAKIITLYYSVDVYSERLSDGTHNGIPFFDKPWKNIVATLYHELNEARTDPDVDDVIATNNLKLWGWADKKGAECGDFPIAEAEKLGSLAMVFKEVPLTSGTGTVPIQLQYSNAVHGPEGPIPAPHH
jgi:hypothetical protein